MEQFEPFNYSDEEKQAFTEGDCWELARLIALTAGHPIVTASSSFSHRDWYHAANRLPDGRILDIEGIWEESYWLQIWSARFRLDEEGDWAIAIDWDLTSFMADIDAKNVGIWFPLGRRADEYAWELLMRTEPMNAGNLLVH